MAGKINDFVTSSGFNELFSGYNQGFQWQIGCTLGSGELRWDALSLGMTEALSQKPILQSQLHSNGCFATGLINKPYYWLILYCPELLSRKIWLILQ